MNAKEFGADNHIMVPGFAIVDLKLSGNELLCYSLIYGFSQDGETEFYGSLHYVASALNITRQNAKRVIDRLLKRGLLEKREINFSGVKFCHYVAKRNGVAETATLLSKEQPGVAESATGGVAETATHNIDIDINNIDDNNNSRARKTTSESLCLFADSRYNKFEDFAACFKGPEYAQIDIAYYWGAVADWSAASGKKKNDWIATARNFMRSDKENKELHLLAPAPQDDSWMRIMQQKLNLVNGAK